MTNGYYDYQDDIGAYTLARSAQMAGIFQKIEGGFDRLPTESEIKLGLVTLGEDNGEANAYVVTLPYAPSQYTFGQHVVFSPANTNTGSSTIDINGLGAKAIRRLDGSALEPGDLPAGGVVELRYDGTVFRFNSAPLGLVSAAIEAASDAADSAAAAAGSASAAAGSATAASGSATSAATSATNANTAKSAAQTARTGAETAKTAAEAAQTAAEDARDQAQTAAAGLTSEVVMDTIATMIAAGTHTGISFTYDDAGNALSAALVDGGTTNAKLASMAQATIKGRASGAGTGAPTDLTAAQVAAIIQSSLALPASAITSGALADGRISQSSVTQHQGALAIAASQVTSGTFANARISQSSVTQHQGALGSEDADNSTIVRRTSQGYIYATYLNVSNVKQDTYDIGNIFFERPDSDGFLRKASLSHLMSSMSLSSIGGSVSNGQVPSSAVTQHMNDGYARNITGQAGYTKTISTSGPSGGSNGDIWYQY